MQYPGVKDSINSDIDNIATLLKLSRVIPKDLSLDSLLSEAKAQLHAEADYTQEAQNLMTFQGLIQGSGTFVTPELVPELCTAHVLAMTYLESEPLETLQCAPQEQRDQLASALIDLVLRELFVFGTMQTDPNFANYRYLPATGQIALLDFGAVKSFDSQLQRNFQALARAALSEDSMQIRDAMLRIGYFSQEMPEKMQRIFIEMFDMAMEPIRQTGPYDFRSSDLMDRLRDRGLQIGTEREIMHVPPADTLFLHRKIGGTYLMASMLGARVSLRPLVEEYVS